MRILPLALLMLVFTNVAHAGAALQLEGYQNADGAISIFQHGNDVDPYFAGKALLVAHDAGLDVREAALAWINWGLQHQRADGGFDRFCRRDSQWVACAPADADDSAAAVWLELLAKLAAANGFPVAWQESADRALHLLKTLRNPASHIYFISAQQPVGLLMDNAEVYSALLAASALKRALGDTGQALELAGQADVLANSIVRVFWQPCRQRLAVSTQKNTRPGFYPDQVAELFPILADIAIPGRNQNGFFKQWLNDNQGQWFAQAGLDFPWGLVAVAADKLGCKTAAACWLSGSAPLRHGRHWNVLEEAVYQALAAKSASSQSCATASAVSGPGQPENVQAQRVDFTSIALRWNAPSGIAKTQGYEILRDGHYLGIAREPLFTDKTAQSGKRYAYSVRAFDALGRFSPPAIPTAINAENDRFASVYLQTDQAQTKLRLHGADGGVLSETPMPSACSGYRVQTLNLTQTGATSLSFSDASDAIDNNRGQRYRPEPGLFVVSRGVVSTNANPCQDRGAPSMPEALAQIAVKPRSVELAWQPATDDRAVSRYVVIRNGAEIADTVQARFTDSCVAPMATYHYQVRAVDSAENQSANSNELVVTTLPE